MTCQKLLLAIILCVGASIGTGAQTLSREMSSAISACSKLSTAIGSESTPALRAAGKALRACKTTDFNSLRLASGKEAHLDGHYIFDEEFADSLVVNRKVHRFAQRYAARRANRGISPRPGQVMLTTKALNAGTRASWKVRGRAKGEFAVVAEPGGRLTMRILDNKGRVLYSDVKDVKKGAPMRSAIVNLPASSTTEVLIEVSNCGPKATSFAILCL